MDYVQDDVEHCEKHDIQFIAGDECHKCAEDPDQQQRIEVCQLKKMSPQQKRDFADWLNDDTDNGL
jgi:hypothetical protein